MRVHEDREVEGREAFSLALSTSSHGLILQPDTADITITEGDGKTRLINTPCSLYFDQIITISTALPTVICLVSSLDTSRGYFAWPETFPGEVARTRCENGSSLRRCNVLGEWEKPDTSSCYVSTNELFRYIGKVKYPLIQSECPD